MCSTNAKCPVPKDEGPNEEIDELKTLMRKLKLDMQDGDKQEFYRGMLDSIDVLMSGLGLETPKEKSESDPAQLQSGAPCNNERAGPSSAKISDEPVISPAQPQSVGEHTKPSDAPTEQLGPSSSKKGKLEPRQVPGGANRKRKPTVMEQLIQGQLLLMMHSQYCPRQVKGYKCSLSSCAIMKKLLNFPYIKSNPTRQINELYKRCARTICSMCPPVIKPFEKNSIRTKVLENVYRLTILSQLPNRARAQPSRERRDEYVEASCGNFWFNDYHL
ncbi:hypothetical protein TSAR_001999 [Trichomalopsis sarcophagae]|uniref:TAZ-type domain-containing protein n=1 Tax=Trichomalopsis sarcophagae TaxID=543379 RepID=A0A232END4_9HYME|nr:hypothetical protein TSAR_001999 [Trichomalopsis sarcophagae]